MEKNNKLYEEQYQPLDPLINKRPLTIQEDQKLWKQYQQFGPKWTKVSKILNGRPIPQNLLSYRIMQSKLDFKGIQEIFMQKKKTLTTLYLKL